MSALQSADLALKELPLREKNVTLRSFAGARSANFWPRKRSNKARVLGSGTYPSGQANLS
jgi:hypothetical protein